MKLFYAPGACSLSPHIVLREAGAEFALERVDPAAGTTESGLRYATINRKGQVPALQFDGGEVLTEGAAVVQFIADRYPDSHLAPAAGTLARARLHEQLNFIAAELHKAFGPLFRPDTSEDGKAAARALVCSKLDHVERQLGDGRDYLLGDTFTVADAYLFTVTTWTRPTGIGLDGWPYLNAYMLRVAARPAVRDALRAEGLAA